MEKKVIVEEITHLLEVIAEQTETIGKHKAYIPQIELDIIMRNIRNLYERYNELGKLNTLDAPVTKYVEEKMVAEAAKQVVPEIPAAQVAPPVVAEIVEVREVLPVAAEMPADVENTVAETLFTEDTLFVEEKKEEPAVIEEILNPVVEVPEKIEASENAEKKTKLPKKAVADLFSIATNTTIADKFRTENKTLNEKFSNPDKKGKSIADKLQEKPIKDLKAAIGINDKFKFINELFDGNLQGYNECIDKLNGFVSFEEAGSFLDSLKNQNNWANENESFAKLSDMIIRRYL